MDSNESVSLSPTQTTPSPSSPGNSSFRIRAPLSSDSDFKTALKVKLTHISSTSSSSISSTSSDSEQEEEFVSGEDEEEDKDEEEENVEKEEEGFSEFPALRPKAMLSGDFDDAIGNEGSGSEVEEDDGVSGGSEVSKVVQVLSLAELDQLDGVVETPRVRVLADEEGEEEYGECSNWGVDFEGNSGPGSVVGVNESLVVGSGEEEISEALDGGEDAYIGEELNVYMEEAIEAEENREVEGQGEEITGSWKGVVVVDELDDCEIIDVGKDVASNGGSLVETNLLGLETGGGGAVEQNVPSEIGSPGFVAAESAGVRIELDQRSKIVVDKVDEGSDLKEITLEQDVEAVAVSGYVIQGELQEQIDEVLKMENDNDEKIGVAKEDEVSALEETTSEQNVDPVAISEFGIQGELRERVAGVEEMENGNDKNIGVGVVKDDGASAFKQSAEENVDPVAISEPEIQGGLWEPVAVVEEGNVVKTGVSVDDNVTADPDNSESEKEQLPVFGDEVDVSTKTSHIPESAVQNSVSVQELVEKGDNGVDHHSESEEGKDSVSEKDTEGLMFDGSETDEQTIKLLARLSGGVRSHSGGESSQDHSQRIDGYISMESDEEADTDGEGESRELFDSAALTALLKAANSAGSAGGTVRIDSSELSRIFSVERPSGLGSSVPSLRSAPRPNLNYLFNPLDRTAVEESESNLSEEEKKKLEKIQLLRVKFLRLVHRLGYSADDSVAAQVLYRLVLAAGKHTSQDFSLEAAKIIAMKRESDEKDDLDFSLNILVLGKAGVGKSATINSIFGEDKTAISAFYPATTSVKEIIGTVSGVKVRIFDTPGLRASVMDQSFNQKMLLSVKKFTKRCPPDILLYVDRLDSQTRDLNDLPLLRSITNTLGSSIWNSAVVALTHAASAPPDGPSGSPLSYEMFVSQWSHTVHQSIGQAVGDPRMMNPSLMNPVSLVENHQLCRRNREGQKILPNGQSWLPQLLLVCYSLKILSEVSSMSKPQDHRKVFGFRVRSPPLPYLLSSLLQSRAHPKLPTDQGVEGVESDVDLEDLDNFEQEEEDDEYDQLPLFKPLKKSQIAKLSREQRNAYLDEYDYRVKLLQKKQWKEELKRMSELKKAGKSYTDDYGNMEGTADQENVGPATVPVPLPDMVMPPSFDADNQAYRYRFLEPTSQLLSRPVLDTNGWDHDCGYDGVSLEQNLAIASRFPAGVAVQITKDKKEYNIHLDSSVAAKHGESTSTLAGFDIQTVGKQLAYVLRGETKFSRLKKNKMAGGVSVTFLGESVATGLKVQDQISIGKRFTFMGTTGAIRSQGDVAYGANMEMCLKDKDYPFDQDETTLGLSWLKWRGDPALGANLQSQISIGRSSKMVVRVGLNNKRSGQITIRTSSSEQLQIALVAIVPIAISIYRSIWPQPGESYFTM